MPELPEVETQHRDLIEAGVVGLSITGVAVHWHRSLVLNSTRMADLNGLIIEDIKRRGKYLHFCLSGNLNLLIHLRMSGSLRLRNSYGSQDSHDRVIVHLSGGLDLVFHDPRKFGRITVTDNPEAILGKLGPEPLDAHFDAAAFYAMLAQRRRKIKALLLDQHFVSGLGNIYVDETLFAAGVHPERVSNTITEEEAARLLDSARIILSSAIEQRGTSLGDGESNFESNGYRGRNIGALKVFQRSGQPCLQCGRQISKTVVAQRATHFCAACQK